MREAYVVVESTKIGGPSKRWVAQACEASKLARENSGNIKIPVLLLQAGSDQIVQAGGQDEFCKKLTSENRCNGDGGQPYVVDDARHKLFIEADTYRTKILSFLSSIE